MNIKERITALREDKRGVSPVIGVIMMIAIVVIIAAVVAAFAYGIIGGVNKAPSTALVVEGVKPDTDVTVTIFQHGGDTITGAFKYNESTNENVWDDIEVRVNGQKAGVGSGYVIPAKLSVFKKNDVNYTEAADPTNSTHWANTFTPGDQLALKFDKLRTDDAVVILHVPSDSLLQRVTVS